MPRSICVKRQQIGIKVRRVILALPNERGIPSMFARKHLLSWLTTAYRQPDPLPNFRACIYPRRHRRLIACPAPPGRVVRARRHWEASGSRNQRGGYRLHIRSGCATSPSHTLHVCTLPHPCPWTPPRLCGPRPPGSPAVRATHAASTS